MNVTIFIDDDVVRRARELARRQGKGLEELLREHLESLVGGAPSEALADELFRVMDESPGHSGGCRFRRGESHEGRA